MSDPIADPALRQKVEYLDETVKGIRGELHEMRSTMATRADMSALQSAISALGERQRPQWSLLVSIMALIVVVLTTVGTLAYWPINAATADLKAGVIALADKVVTLRQYEQDTALSRQDRQSIRADLTMAVNSTIQQQRYNSDKTARDAEITILRERFDKVLTRSEFAEQHGDLKKFIESMMSTRERQMADVIKRVERLENKALQH